MSQDNYSLSGYREPKSPSKPISGLTENQQENLEPVIRNDFLKFEETDTESDNALMYNLKTNGEVGSNTWDVANRYLEEGDDPISMPIKDFASFMKKTLTAIGDVNGLENQSEGNLTDLYIVTDSETITYRAGEEIAESEDLYREFVGEFANQLTMPDEKVYDRIPNY